MDDDFNTPEALAVLFELTKELNIAKAGNDAKADDTKAAELAKILTTLGGLLGLLQAEPQLFLQGSGDDDDVAEIERLIQMRADARKNKDWALADQARDQLNALNIELEDNAGTTQWRRK